MTLLCLKAASRFSWQSLVASSRAFACRKRDYIRDCTKLQEGPLCPLLSLMRLILTGAHMRLHGLSGKVLSKQGGLLAEKWGL